MRIKSTTLALFLLFFSLAFSGCKLDDPAKPIIIVEPPEVLLTASDTITTGSYLNFIIGETAESTYSVITSLSSEGVTYLNIVSNIFSDITDVKGKLPLYQSVLLDEMKGSSTGVQIAIENDKVKSIFLNSGKQLDKWPMNVKSSLAVARGNGVETLYGKLAAIRTIQSYKKKFERISLITKDLSKSYDPHMSLSPQWYFAYQTEEHKMDEVKLNFQDGILSSIHVNHYQSYP